MSVQGEENEQKTPWHHHRPKDWISCSHDPTLVAKGEYGIIQPNLKNVEQKLEFQNPESPA